MNHKWVSVGTRRFCVKCGQDFASASVECGAGINPKPKKKTTAKAKKQAENEVLKDEEV